MSTKSNKQTKHFEHFKNPYLSRKRIKVRDDQRFMLICMALLIYVYFVSDIYCSYLDLDLLLGVTRWHHFHISHTLGFGDWAPFNTNKWFVSVAAWRCSRIARRCVRSIRRHSSYGHSTGAINDKIPNSKNKSKLTSDLDVNIRLLFQI